MKGIELALVIGAVIFFGLYSIINLIAFLKRSREFSRPRTRDEKIALMLNQIEPRVIFDGYREIKNEEDAYYSSLILDYQIAEFFGSKAADPRLSLKDLQDPEKNAVLANRILMDQIETEVEQELGMSIHDLILRLNARFNSY